MRYQATSRERRARWRIRMKSIDGNMKSIGKLMDGGGCVGCGEVRSTDGEVRTRKSTTEKSGKSNND